MLSEDLGGASIEKNRGTAVVALSAILDLLDFDNFDDFDGFDGFGDFNDLVSPDLAAFGFAICQRGGFSTKRVMDFNLLLN